MRRVVITGLGMVTPLGWGVETTWKALLAGKSGAGRITAFDTTDYACQIACEVPRVNGRGGAEPSADVVEIRQTPPSVSVPSTSIRNSLILRARTSTSGAASSSDIERF